jgi:hypothetical protein
VSDDDFYDAQSEASQIKARIVTKYFRFWAKVMIPQAKSWANALAFHFKQWGGANKKRSGRILDGRTWDELPVNTQKLKHDRLNQKQELWSSTTELTHLAQSAKRRLRSG